MIKRRQWKSLAFGRVFLCKEKRGRAVLPLDFLHLPAVDRDS